MVRAPSREVLNDGKTNHSPRIMEEASLLTVGALEFFLTVELLCLQSIEVLVRRTFPLQSMGPRVAPCKFAEVRTLPF